MFTDDPLALLLLAGLVLKGAGLVMQPGVAMRGLLAAGFACDVLWFATRTEAALALTLGSIVLVAINLTFLALYLRDRSMRGVSDRDRRLFKEFDTLSPGQFRQVIRLATWHIAEKDRAILTEGEASDQLFYIDAPAFRMIKRGKSYATRGPAFAGEVMFLHGGVSSATVELPKGTMYVSWPAEKLKAQMARSKPLENALVARFNLDMAEKVSVSVPVTQTPFLKR